MRWAGKPRNWGKWVALGTHPWAMNASFIEPLNARELAGIVKSIVRYQRRNLESGQQQEMFSRIQAARGKKSGAARRYKTVERDEAIIRAVGRAVYAVCGSGIWACRRDRAPYPQTDYSGCVMNQNRMVCLQRSAGAHRRPGLAIGAWRRPERGGCTLSDSVRHCLPSPSCIVTSTNTAPAHSARL